MASSCSSYKLSRPFETDRTAIPKAGKRKDDNVRYGSCIASETRLDSVGFAGDPNYGIIMRET